MKKISRVKKAKVIEKAKTIILAGLFLSCLFFCYKIFLTYREQALADNFWGGAGTANDTASYETMTAENQAGVFDRLTQPDFVLINKNQGRTILSGNSHDFDEMCSLANKMICLAYGLTSEEITEIGKKEWETALRTNSIYLRYPMRRYTTYETEFHQIKSSGLSKILTDYSEALIVPASDGSSTVLLRSSDSGKTVKAKIICDETKSVLRMMDKNGRQGTADYVFASELNLDEEVSGKATLDPMLLINTDKIMTKDIVADVPKLYKTGLNFTKATEFVTDLINIFGYNPNTIRQYISQENALIFVGENGNLSIYPDGKVEYKALGINEGVPLMTTGNGGNSATAVGLCSVIEKIMKVSGIDLESAGFDIKFAKQPQGTTANKKMEFFFDYFSGGKKVIFGDGPAIYMAVEGGRLVELKMQVKNIKELDSETFLDTVIGEIDKVFSQNSDNTKINGSSIVYRYNKNGEKIHATWQILSER